MFYTDGLQYGAGLRHTSGRQRRLEGRPAARPKSRRLIFANGLLFMVNDTGIVTCLDAANGAEVWRSRVPDSYSASPILAEGRIYFFSEDGRTTVIEAGREFRPLAENTLEAIR